MVGVRVVLANGIEAVAISRQVTLKGAELEVGIEMMPQGAIVFVDKHRGVGGLPAGTALAPERYELQSQVAAVALSLTVLRTSVSWGQVIGVSLVVAGIILIQVTRP